MLIILRHVPYEGPGLIEDMLQGRGLPYKVIDVFEEGVPLGAAGFSGIVSMGGPMSVNDGLEVIDADSISRRDNPVIETSFSQTRRGSP